MATKIGTAVEVFLGRGELLLDNGDRYIGEIIEVYNPHTSKIIKIILQINNKRRNFNIDRVLFWQPDKVLQ